MCLILVSLILMIYIYLSTSTNQVLGLSVLKCKYTICTVELEHLLRSTATGTGAVEGRFVVSVGKPNVTSLLACRGVNRIMFQDIFKFSFNSL